MDSLKIRGVSANFNHVFRADRKEEVENSEKSKSVAPKKVSMPIITSVLALTSLGLAGAAMIKTGRKPAADNDVMVKELESKIEKLLKDLKEVKEAKNETKVPDDITNTINNLKEQIKKLPADSENKINELMSKINSIESIINQVQPAASKITSVDVEINGQSYRLASTMHGYGIGVPKGSSDVKQVKSNQDGQILAERLQTEASKRIFGATDSIQLPNNPTIRVPSSELTGFAKTGGLAVVPIGIIANLGAIINNKQDVEILADTPLYLGQVNEKKWFDIKKDPSSPDKYTYYQIDLKDDGTEKESVMANLTLVDTMELPIYTEDSRTIEKVKVYISDQRYSQVDFAAAMAQLEPDFADEVTRSLSAGKVKETKLMRFSPAQPERAVLHISDGKKVYAFSFNADKAEVVSVFSAQEPDIGTKVDKNLIKNKKYTHNLTQPINDSVLNMLSEEDRSSFERIITDLNERNMDASISVEFLPKTDAKAEAKYKAVFYQNDKFRMSGPLRTLNNEGNTVMKDIYSNVTTEAGETERFIYFSKFFYENILRNHETSSLPLKADAIIGNDWQTGPISAMVRQLTMVRETMGDLTPKTAQKIYNTPIVTIMHNFKLSGQAYHSQAKLLNILFGEHSAMIAKNCYMPYGTVMNGLMPDNGINPQTMAMAYSDDIVFVSVGNHNEASTVPEKGGINYSIAAMRSRTGEYADENYLKKMAGRSGILSEQISARPTAKGITNGCDRVSNIISDTVARALEANLGLKEGSLIPEYKAMEDPYRAHQNNKDVYLEKVISELNLVKSTKGVKNPMAIIDWEHTDFTGVNKDTPVFGNAGRLVDQKGLDIWAEGILKYYKSGNYDRENPPVFYLQGRGDAKNAYVKKYLEVKEKVREICPKAADRMMFANLFDEAGRYDGCKMMSDFLGMTSWDEPCGLVHKEVGYFSGAISIVNKVGGLTDGLDGYQENGDNSKSNSIFLDFIDKDTHKYEDALAYDSDKLAKGLELAVKWYNDKDAFSKGIENSYKARFDWLGGKIQQYAEILKVHGVLAENIDSHY